MWGEGFYRGGEGNASHVGNRPPWEKGLGDEGILA